jgi:peptide/nickel transport system substrate-binding protein
LGVRRFAALALALLACSPAPRRGATVILASGADLQSPNPLVTTHPLARQVQRYALLVTLVRHDSTLTAVPYLARDWTWSAPRTELRLRIFRGLRWHDGAATTAADAAFTLERALDPATGYPRRADLGDLVSVAAPDDSTLLLRFSAPQAGIPDVLTDLAILPRHLLDSVPPARLRQAGWNYRPVGNGPFRFVAYEPSRRWVFEAWDGFPPELGGRPLLDRFVVAVVDEPTTKLAALTSGELDFAGINPAHARFVRENPGLAVLDYPLLLSYALVFNTRVPPFDRVEARRAVAVAVDPGALVDGVLFGYGTPATGPLPPELGGGSVGVPAIPAGQTNPLEFELLSVGSGEAALEQQLQAQLAGRGHRARIRLLELATFLGRVEAQSPAFQAAVLGLSGDLALGHLRRLVGLSGLVPARETGALLEQIQHEVPALFLYHARGVQGMNRRVRGVHMDLRGELVTLSRWRIAAGEAP